MKKIIIISLATLLSAFSYTALSDDFEIVAAGDGKAYLLNSATGEIKYLNNGAIQNIAESSDLKNHLISLVDSKNTSPEIVKFSSDLLFKFYHTKKSGKYWIEIH